MLDKFKEVEAKFSDIERRISDPDIISNQPLYQTLIQEHSELKEGVDTFRRYQSVSHEIAETEGLLKDPELRAGRVKHSGTRSVVLRLPEVEGLLKVKYNGNLVKPQGQVDMPRILRFIGPTPEEE